MSKKNPKEEERLVVYGLYSTFIQSIKHFDSLQTAYRIMTSRLLLATFAAIGFILSTEIKVLPFSRLIAVDLICLISLGAITTLWHLDLAFIERLSMSVFIEALRLEEKHGWLTKAHSNMIDDETHAACPSRKVIFYLGSMLTILLTMGIAATLYAVTINEWIWIPVVIVAVLITIFYLGIIKKSTRSFNALLHELEEKNHGK